MKLHFSQAKYLQEKFRLQKILKPERKEKLGDEFLSQVEYPAGWVIRGPGLISWELVLLFLKFSKKNDILS